MTKIPQNSMLITKPALLPEEDGKITQVGAAQSPVGGVQAHPGG